MGSMVVDWSPAGIRRLRESLGQTRSEFAAELEVTPQTVWNWEEGKNKPARTWTRRNIRDLAASLHETNPDRLVPM